MLRLSLFKDLKFYVIYGHFSLQEHHYQVVNNQIKVLISAKQPPCDADAQLHGLS